MRHEDRLDIYKYMIESSRDIVFLLDNHNTFAFLNDRVEKLLGFTRQELVDQHYSTIIYPADIAHADLNFNICRGPTESELSRSIELRFKSKLATNSYRCFDIKVSNIPVDVSNTYSKSIFADETGRHITSYGVARDITQNKLIENIIYTNANYDSLTGLPNRVLLKDRINQSIAQAKREGRIFVVMFFDLDGFKQVNDKFGHSAGDVLLQMVSARLKDCLREADTLARVGGDEFMLLLPGTSDVDEVKKIADKVLYEINRPYVLSGHKLALSASIGVALYPDNGETFDTLINAADRAMYHIKHRNKNGYVFLSDLPLHERQENILIFS